MQLGRVVRHRRVMAARQRLGELRHRQLYPLLERVDALEARFGHDVPAAPGLTPQDVQAVCAPLLWQDLGRPPRPSLPAISKHAETLPARVRELRWPQADVLVGLSDTDLLDAAARDTYPLPDPDDRVHYSAGDDQGYWLSGLADALTAIEIVQQAGLELGAGSRVMDFGCSSGRVLRHFSHLLPGAELYGVDLSTVSLIWAREHLSPDLILLQGTILPSLPLADRSLDVVFAGSVFTHMGVFEEAWLSELRRVLRPGGLALLSIHPERTWLAIGRGDAPHLAAIITRTRHRADPPGVEPADLELFRTPMPADRMVVADVNYPINQLLTFHREAWIRRTWAAILDVVEVREQGHGHHQDLVVLRAPVSGG